MSVSWYWFHLVHLVLNAKNLILMWKTTGNVFLGDSGESFSSFPKVALNHGGGGMGGAPNTL